MKTAPKIGSTGEVSFTVSPEHTIDFAHDGMPAVLATPWLIWFLEHSAREAVLPLLEPGESTVGVHIDVQHLAATPTGHRVTCRARIIHREGTLIRYQLEAIDEYELIARGLHKLRVINVERFARRIRDKAERRHGSG